MNSEKTLESLYDHYKETYELSRTSQVRRNRYFVVLCILEAISFMLVWNPDLICGLLNDSIRKEIETTIIISNSILQTLMWTLILYCLVRYIQEMLYVERQYQYLSKLENRISVLMNESGVFDRESDNYTKDYPIVLNMIDLLYKVFFPILFTTINIIHIIQERKRGHSLSAIADLIICILAVILTWFYFFETHENMTKWCKSHIPFVQSISDILHKVLKSV